MRKQELVHIHSLLAVVRKELTTREQIPENAFEEYDASGVGPTAIAKSKAEHEDAIGQLLEGVDRTLSAHDQPTNSPSIV